MSTKHIYFFDDSFDTAGFDYVVKKYDGLFVRKVEKCLMPAELSRYSAYTLDDHHINIGIGDKILNSAEFKEQLEYWEMLSSKYDNPGYTRLFIEKAEDTEKYTLTVKHMLFDILLCCGIDTVGVAAMYQSDDVVSLDLRDFNVEYKRIWDVTLNTLADMRSENTVYMIERFGNSRTPN